MDNFDLMHETAKFKFNSASINCLHRAASPGYCDQTVLCERCFAAIAHSSRASLHINRLAYSTSVL